jgi:hypothetical protein
MRIRVLTKPLLFSTLTLCLAAGTAQASEIFTLTQDPDFVLSSSSGATSVEQAWDFTALPGWTQSLVIQSIVITETFSTVSPFPFLLDAFQSTILNGPYQTNPGTGQTEDYFIFDNATSTLMPAATVTATIDAPYPCCVVHSSQSFTLADITNPTGNVLGQFDTRVAHNAGTFELDSMTIEIIAAGAPEPAGLALMGFGLTALALMARRRA